MNDWNIQARSRVCHLCGEPFKDKQTYHTVLLTGEPRPVRYDFCSSCWQRETASGLLQNPQVISYWKGTYIIPPKPTEAIERNTAELLLKKLATTDDPNSHAVVYILALMLERKKIIKLKKRAYINGKTTLIYEHKETGESYTITEPTLTPDQIHIVHASVTKLLEQEIGSQTA